MTRLLISAAFAGLVAFGGSALAQDDHRDRGGRGQQAPEAPHQGGGPANTPRGNSSGGFMNFGAARGGAPAANPAPGNAARGSDENRQGRAMNNPAPAPSNAMRGPSSNERVQNNNDRGRDNNNNNMRGPNNDRRGFNDNGRGPDQRRDFSAYHRNFNAPRRFRAPAYHRPSGWYAHRWTYGEILPSMFWAQSFWLNDYVDFDLPPPPPGTVWVRDGDDALLIDRFSGEIIQVEYSVFY